MPLPESEFRSFLDAIAANPGEDTPRLAFADWLQEHDDPRAAWVRDAGLWAWMAPDAGDPVPRILGAMADPAHRQRGTAPDGLFHLVGPTAVPVVRAWVRETPDDRFESVWQFLKAARPPNLGPVSALMVRIQTGTWYDVWEAVVDLGFHGPTAAPAVDLLLDLPQHDKWEEFSERYHRDENPITGAVARTLGEIGPAAKKAIPLLAGSGWYNEAAWDVLPKLKPDPIEVLDHLNTDDTHDTEEGVRVVAALDPTKTGALVHAVRYHTGRVRYSACTILAEMGPDAADTVPALTEVLLGKREWDWDYARGGILCAIRATGEAARSTLATVRAALYARRLTPQKRIDIGVALAWLGEPGEGWAVLHAALEEMTPTARAKELVAVSSVAASCEQAAPYLLAALRSRSQALRESAAQRLSDLTWRNCLRGHSQLDWIPALLGALEDRSATVRWSAACGLGQIGQRNEPVESQVPPETRAAVIDGLLQLLCDKTADDSGQFHARVALGLWGELPAHAAQPLQRYLARKRDERTREQIGELIARVRRE